MPRTGGRPSAATGPKLAPGRAGVQGAEPPGFSVFLYVVHRDAQKAWAKRLRRKWPKEVAQIYYRRWSVVKFGQIRPGLIRPNQIYLAKCA